MEPHELVREELTNEISTKNHRINWMLVTQSFIFAAFGIVSKFIPLNTESAVSTVTTSYQSLIHLIPAFGATLTLLTLIGVSGCYVAIYGLNKQYNKLIIGQENIETLKTLIFKDPLSRNIGVFYSYSLCFLFLIMWAVIYFTIIA